MSRPFLLVQLSDPHIGADWAEGDPTARFAAAVQSVRALGRPDAVLVSGDLADHASDAEYEVVRGLLDSLGVPIYVLPGTTTIAAPCIGTSGYRAPTASRSVLLDLGRLRLVVLDSTRPGEDPGSLDGGRLGWLDAELAAAPEIPTIVALHHPPILTGVPVWDDLGLPLSDRRRLRTSWGATPTCVGSSAATSSA